MQGFHYFSGDCEQIVTSRVWDEHYLFEEMDIQKLPIAVAVYAYTKQGNIKEQSSPFILKWCSDPS